MNSAKHQIIVLKPVQDYIDEQLKNHREPERRGTPRGEAIGFSKVKFKASLYSALTCWNEREMAKQLGISYEVLRQWHTQDEFQNKIDHNIQEFRTSFRKRLGEIGDARHVRFGDAHIWSEIVAANILRAIEEHVDTEHAPNIEPGFHRTLTELQKTLPEWKYPRSRSIAAMSFFEREDPQDPRALIDKMKRKLEARMQQRIVAVIRSNPEGEVLLQSLEVFLGKLHSGEHCEGA